MNDYLFEVVGEAWQTVAENFGTAMIVNDEIKCIGKYTPEEAEWLGYDTY